MREFVFRYFWVLSLSLVAGAPYILWTAKVIFNVIDSFRRTIKNRNYKLCFSEQMKLYLYDSTENWITTHLFLGLIILMFGGLFSLLYYFNTLN